jgi:hypothetical protein
MVLDGKGLAWLPETLIRDGNPALSGASPGGQGGRGVLACRGRLLTEDPERA